MHTNNERLEVILQNLGDALGKGDLTVKEVLQILSVKVNLVLLILLSLCAFVALPGITIIFGCLIIYTAVRMVMGKSLWLPKKVLAMKAPNGFLKVVASKGVFLINKIKKFTRPRFRFVLANPFMRIFNGVLIILLGLTMVVLPIPFAAFFSAAAVFLLCLGLLEDDGLFVMLGYLMCLITIGATFGIGLFVEKSRGK